jgi:hypothetical protein
MSLNISDDDIAGFAIIDFQQDIGTYSITITLKSKLLHQGEYFGAGGKWTAAPHFFKAVRVPDRGPGLYRIGPEIVNQSGLTLDLVEVSVHGTAIAEAVTWPLLLHGRDAQPLHVPTTVPPAPAGGLEAVQNEAQAPAPPEKFGAEQQKPKPQAEETGPAAASSAGEPAAAGRDTPSEDSPEQKEAVEPSSEETPMKPDTRLSGPSNPLREPKSQAAQERLFWQEPTGAGTVLALLPEQSHHRRLGVWYGLTALSVAGITVLFAAVWLFCIPFSGGQCKGGTSFGSRTLCASGRGGPEACGVAAALRHPAQTLEEGGGGATAPFQLKAQPGTEDREAIETRAAVQALAEEDARENLRRAAEERRRAEEAAQLSAQREAAEHLKAEEAARLSAQREAQERLAAEAAAQARQEAPQPAPMMASLNPVQENAALSIPDGDYSGRTARDEGCSPAAESVIVTIKGGRVCWEHELKSPNRWAGTIGPDGIIQARADGRAGTRATGRIVNGGAMSVEMAYPDCANPVRLKLLGMIGKASTCP